MTDIIDFIDLLGHSIKSDRIIDLMKIFNISKSRQNILDINGNVMYASYSSPDRAFQITFEGYRRYRQEYGEPLFVESTVNDELILFQIDVLDNYETSMIKDALCLPFNLKVGDDKDTIISKLKKKPSQKSNVNSGIYKYAWWFYYDDYRILTALDKDYKLIWMRVILIDILEKKKLELKRTLNLQNNNIKPESKNMILSFEHKLVRQRWEDSMMDGDSMFTQESIDAVDLLLKNFISDLAKLVDGKKASNIYNVTKKLVLALNKINIKYKNVIETSEREELCFFINEIVKETGFFIDSNLDFTQEWREW